MRLSTASVLALFTTAQAGIVGKGVQPRYFGSRALMPMHARQEPADAALTALEGASKALKEATTAVDEAIATLGGKEATDAADKAPAKVDATAPASNGTAPANDAAAPGGAIKAVTADGKALPDGRVKKDAVATDFDVLASVFKSGVVRGDGLLFSDIITFPDVEASIFDAAGETKAFEISINDSSIFIPGGGTGEPQTQFRRADLLPSIISCAEDSCVTGVRTMHFSLQQDPAKPLALTTNEYQLAFIETEDFASRQFDVRVGTGKTSASLTGENIVVLGRSGADIKELFVAPFSEELQNFAVTLDFDANTIQVFHSVGTAPLASVSEVVENDNSGLGEYHFALLKLPDEAGAQTPGIDEGIIYAGIFMEDSTGGKVTLQ